MTEYRINNNKNGVELVFDKKPAADVLTMIKGAGFRWSPKGCLWYAKQTAERVALAKKIADGVKIAPDKQAALREKYRALIADVWHDDKMRAYCDKNAAYIVELNDGDICEIERPRIETRFCFGYGWNGVSYGDDDRDAAAMAQHARTSEEYFIHENLKGIESEIEDLKNNSMYYYKYVHYTGSPDNCPLKCVSGARAGYNLEYAPERWSHCRGLKELTQEERDAMIAGLETVKAAFIKRLNTYLKRYGLTKIDSWTYLRD